jgi:malonyl-CoA O-methyltransferase
MPAADPNPVPNASGRLDVAQVRRRFARAGLAPGAYDRAAALQHEVARRMLERLDYVKLEPALVIDAGCGAGHALPGLARRFPDSRLLAVDFALPLLARAREAQAGRMPHWISRWLAAGPWLAGADFARLPLADASAGCIWSNLALHWVNDPLAAFAEWHRALCAGGLAQFSLLGPDTLKELRAAWRPAGGLHVHRFADMHDIGDMLIHAGFADPVMDMETITLTYTAVDDLVCELRSAGAVNAQHGRSRGLAGRKSWAAMRSAYEALRVDGKLPATFEIVYGHAWKPEPVPGRPDRTGEAVLRVEDIGRSGGGTRRGPNARW